MSISDNYDLWLSRERDQEEWLKSRPKCYYCKEPIQEERLMVVVGELYHIRCAERLFGVDTEDYIY